MQTTNQNRKHSFMNVIMQLYCTRAELTFNFNLFSLQIDERLIVMSVTTNGVDLENRNEVVLIMQQPWLKHESTLRYQLTFIVNKSIICNMVILISSNRSDNNLQVFSI
jgi:hypothetical protein